MNRNQTLTVSITGANGFVGRNVGRQFAKKGIQVIRIIRKDRTSSITSGTVLISHDLSEKRLIPGLRKCSALLHFIGQGKQTVDNDYEKDGEKLKHIIEAYRFLKLEEKNSHKKSEVDIESTYTTFWRYYDKTGNESQFSNGVNFGRFDFGVNVNEMYERNQEKPTSHILTHILLYGGLGVMALWIILSGILK